MREILFRGKTKRNEWIYGDLITHGIDFDDAIKQHHTREVWDIIPESVGQFTGLTDKNGKKIFEGDIIKLYLRDDVTTVGDIRYSEEDCRFKFWEDFEYPYGFDITTPFEVIGNIHDNPEFLGE